MNNAAEERLHAFVKGRVQGVGFRYFVMTTAGELNLTGWVRNRRDGSVEVTAEGPRNDLEKLLKALGRGPGSAHVTDLQQQWLEAEGEFHGFKIRQTL